MIVFEYQIRVGVWLGGRIDDQESKYGQEQAKHVDEYGLAG